MVRSTGDDSGRAFAEAAGGVSRKNSIKVKVRVQAARAAGRWFADELAKHPGLDAKFGPSTVAFFMGLVRRSTTTLELDRAFADRLVHGWRLTFRLMERNDLLLAVGPDERAPVIGIDALAEIVNDIGAALAAPEGRPPKVDPLEAAEAVERARRRRRRGDKQGAADMAVAELSKELGEHVGLTALETAAAKGRRVRKNLDARFEDVAAAFPGAAVDPLFVLTTDGTEGAAAVIVRPKKNP